MAPLRVIIYTRISKDRSGLSENTGIQLEECREYAADEGWLVVAEFEENDISASKYSKKPRPDYRTTVQMLKDNLADAVLSTEQERLQRMPTEMNELIEIADKGKRKLWVKFTNDDGYDLSDGEGIYRARVAVANAERESNKISKRQKRKKAARARQGLPTGGRRPYGYEQDMITINEHEAEIYRRMVSLYLAGVSCKHIAYQLNEAGERTSTGKLFYGVTIWNLLQKPRYKGVRQHLGNEYPAVWKPIVDEATWERVQLRIKARRLTAPTSVNARKYLLTRVVLCGRCGQHMTGRSGTDHPGGPVRRYYHCKIQGDTQRRGGCALRRNADALDAFIRDAVIYRLDSPELGVLLQSDTATDHELGKLLEARALQQQRKKQLVKDYATGLLDTEELREAKLDAQTELDRLDGEIAKLGTSTHVTRLSPGETLREAWDKADNDWRRELISQVIENIEVMPGNTKPFYKVDGNTYRFDPKLIRINWRV